MQQPYPGQRLSLASTRVMHLTEADALQCEINDVLRCNNYNWNHEYVNYLLKIQCVRAEYHVLDRHYVMLNCNRRVKNLK